jgi:uncharacterized membrane protein
MKKLSAFVFGRLVAGALVVVPTYLAVLLVLKGIKSLAGIMKPFAQLLPKWLPAGPALSLLVLLVGCFFIGVALRTRVGFRLWNLAEKSFFGRIPGYALIHSLTQRLAGEDRETAWKPALAEVEEALVPAFIIEELEDRRFTVFVPSVPTPLAGAVYILSAERVHPLNVPFTQAIKIISRWGSGSKDLVAAMEGGRKLAAANERGGR